MTVASRGGILSNASAVRGSNDPLKRNLRGLRTHTCSRSTTEHINSGLRVFVTTGVVTRGETINHLELGLTTTDRAKPNTRFGVIQAKPDSATLHAALNQNFFCRSITLHCEMRKIWKTFHVFSVVQKTEDERSSRNNQT